MADQTLAEQLTEVRAAISRILTTAQSIIHEGEGITHASLQQLTDREKYLVAQVARQGGISRTLGEM